MISRKKNGDIERENNKLIQVETHRPTPRFHRAQCRSPSNAKSRSLYTGGLMRSNVGDELPAFEWEQSHRSSSIPCLYNQEITYFPYSSARHATGARHTEHAEKRDLILFESLPSSEGPETTNSTRATFAGGNEGTSHMTSHSSQVRKEKTMSGFVAVSSIEANTIWPCNCCCRAKLQESLISQSAWCC